MSDPINLIANWLQGLLLGLGLSVGLTKIILSFVGAVVVATIGMLTVIFLIWLERKIAGRIQDRLGPNRAGPYGLLQPFADVIKILTKEYTTPDGADVVVYNIAPIMAVASVLLIWAVIPFASTVVGTNLNVGVLYIMAVGAFGLLSILMAGLSSNNKFALLGAFRSVAQLISYEIPMVVSLLMPVIFARSMGLVDIVEAQMPWFIILSPLAALIFIIASMAEVNRAPFDLMEAESEIVAGFHIEYSGMKFGMFYVGEFLHVFTVGALVATLFLGGWRGPWAEQYPILGLIYFYIKTFVGYFIVAWVRLTVPRIRIDQMLDFNWKFLTPLSLVLLIITAVLDRVLVLVNSERWVYSLVMFLANILIIWATVEVLKKTTSKPKRKEFPMRPVAMAPETSTSTEPSS
ncbi:MAG TPA: NADH-quinone oxidoreductase subunit NuoH [Anaerolineae bacterium]|nr:NADH-quinone oxidoreductase subunit NuoH [Anaerolineae bacterium]